MSFLASNPSVYSKQLVQLFVTPEITSGNLTMVYETKQTETLVFLIKIPFNSSKIICGERGALTNSDSNSEVECESEFEAYSLTSSG